MAIPRRARLEVVTEQASVTPLELFFDLVFVFALTQVTGLLAADPTARGLVRGVLVLAIMWWAWVGYSWLGNVVRADEGLSRVVMFAAMAALFVAAMTIPEAFTDEPGGLAGPKVFAVCYFVVRLAHLLLFWIAASASGDDGLRRQLIRWTPSVITGTVFLLLASQTSGLLQTVLWACALLGDYLGTLLAGASGWRLNSAGHFAERHGLMVIVALGESIVSIGVGVSGLAVSWPIVVASVLGLTVAGALWWAYFDVTSLLAERALAASRGHHRALMARTAYTFLHLPIVVGVIVLALGLKKVLGYVGGQDGHTLADHLHGVPLMSLYGGSAMYLLALVAFKYRTIGLLNRARLGVGLALPLLIPVAGLLPALVTLGALALVLVGLIAYETRTYAEIRDHARHEPHTSDSHPSDSHAAGRHASDPQASGPHASGPQAAGRHASGPQASGPHAADSHEADRQSSDPQASDPEGADSGSGPRDEPLPRRPEPAG
jgi:low temperature requirement protein LtrA